MQRSLVLGLFALTVPAVARADVAVPTPPAHRVALTDAIVLGRVIAHEDKDVEAAIPGGGKTVYRVALVSVGEAILGAKGKKTVRVGFVVRKKPPFPVGRPEFGNPQLDIGLDGLFFLSKHPSENLYLAPAYYDVLPRVPPAFDKELTDVRRLAKLLDNPLASLKADSAEDRFQTAALLVGKYRAPRTPAAKAEPIAEEESKLILKAILEATWGAPQVFGKAHPWSTFLQLGLGPKDGWTPPAGKGIAEHHQAARAWLEKNGPTYRIQRWVAAEAGKR